MVVSSGKTGFNEQAMVDDTTSAAAPRRPSRVGNLRFMFVLRFQVQTAEFFLEQVEFAISHLSR